MPRELRYETVPPGYSVRWWRTSDYADADCWYWVIEFQGAHVNGGVADSVENAVRLSDQYRYRDIVARHFWDEEAAVWISKGLLNVM